MSGRSLLFAAAIVAAALCWPAAAAPLTEFGTRPVATCPDYPAGDGAIPAETALRLSVCSIENADNSTIFLVKSMTVEVGAARQIDYALDILPNIKDGTLVYPLRGRFVQYQCTVPMAVLDNIGHNCTETEVPQATGKCWVTAFGNWSCAMSGDFGAVRHDVAPPAQ